MPRKRSFALAVVVVATVLAGVRADAVGPSGYEFVTMPDGVKIAVSVTIPDACTQRRCPAIFEMSGYDGGAASADGRGTMAKEYGIPRLPHGDSRQLTDHYDDEYPGREYVIVHASVRGTGCSGGEFDLFSWQGALDGKYIIDSWIPTQPWSNGDVAIVGHSYGGITGTLVAATQPDHLRAVSVSGLIDDLYRGIVYPGGVSNYGFPLLWTGATRPVYDVGGGVLPRLVRPVTDGYESQSVECGQAMATKSRTALNDPIVQGVSDTDTDWFRARSLINHVQKIDVPVHITGAYQDEQTGARGPAALWEAIRTPKRLVLTNGDHGTAGIYAGTHVTRDRVDWLNHYLYGVPFASGLSTPTVEPSKPVRVYLESAAPGNPNGIIDSASFPLPETVWTDWYFAPHGVLSETPPPDGGSASYVAGSARHGWFRETGEAGGTPFTSRAGPDMLTFASLIQRDTIVAGPIVVSLDVSTTATDTELFVEVVDQAPDGTRAYLQRGLLKASHRAILPSHSQCVDRATNARVACGAPGALLYRPYRPHVAAEPLTPGTPTTLVVEVWPLGHVFRRHHQLRVHITTPPAADNYYVYVPKRPVGVNTVHFGPASKITMPVIDASRATFAKPLGAPRSCTQQDSLRCLRPGQY